MRQIPKYRAEVDRLLAELEGDKNTKPEKDPEIPPFQEDHEPDAPAPDGKIFDVWTIPFASGKVGVIAIPADDNGRVYDSTFVEPDTEVPSDPVTQPTLEEEYLAAQHGEKASRQAGLLTMSFFLFLCLSCLAVQIHFIVSPPVATITIIPKSQTVTVSASLHIGRVLTPITLSQSQTVPTTGKGHQDPQFATGTITFYNGQLQSVFVSAGTILTGSDGVQIETSQDANIPAANLPQVSQATVSAHAVTIGSSGNIASYDINQGCCNGVKAVNATSFGGGQDERNFQTVAKGDIDGAASQLRDLLNTSTQAALQAELHNGETLGPPICAPTVGSDHHVGEEATQVKVSVSITCSAVTYNTTSLQQQATHLLTQKALQTLGAGYSLYGTIQIAVSHATGIPPTPTLVVSLTGTWAYAISDREQERIKRLITGRTYQDALRILHSLPGIENVSMNWDEHTKLPKNSQYIHLVLITGM